jgi:hypothetical protein
MPKAALNIIKKNHILQVEGRVDWVEGDSYNEEVKDLLPLTWTGDDNIVIHNYCPKI